MTPADLQASVDAFLRDGGAITMLNYAGVPVHPEPEAGIQPYSAYGRNYPARTELPPGPNPVPLRRRIDPPDTTPEEDAEFAGWLAEVLTPAPVAEKPCIITQLRRLRADARRSIARAKRLEASLRTDT